MSEEHRYLHKDYERVEEHTGDSKWQTCMCRSCQDKREGLNAKVGPIEG